VVDKVALGQFFLRNLLFTISVSFHLDSLYSYNIWGMINRPVGGRSSETSSHPIDMNNNNPKNLTTNTAFRHVQPQTYFNLAYKYTEEPG
jgi:hypothetical protein